MSEFWNRLLERARAATFSDSCVTVSGRREVMIENASHVYECNEITARVSTSDGDVIVWGEELSVSSFKESTVRVSGRIQSLEFIKKAGIKDD